ncbi:MAG: hypothetical protein QM654_13650 [Dysgonamonadaceae bacterium]
MKTIYLYILSFLTVNAVSCRFGTPGGYTKFQTFNEYKLKGEGRENVKSPCVFVKESKDTIWVIKSNSRNVIMMYINKGEYWYHQTEKELYGRASYKTYIVNDTLFVYDYMPMPGAVSGTTAEGVIIETKSKMTIIENYKIFYNDENDLYKKIREAASNYKDSMPCYDHDRFMKGELPEKFYCTYDKVFKGNLYYMYRNQETKPYTCTYSIRELNSLGEFDLENAKDVAIPKGENCWQ